MGFVNSWSLQKRQEVPEPARAAWAQGTEGTSKMGALWRVLWREARSLARLVLDELELLHGGLDGALGRITERHHWETALLRAQA